MRFYNRNITIKVVRENKMGNVYLKNFKWQLIVFIIALIAVAFLLLRMQPVKAAPYAAKVNHYYTWGIKTEKDLDIEVGSIPTEVTLTIKGLTNTSENSDDVMYINLLDNPPEGFISNIDWVEGNFFNPAYTSQTVKRYIRGISSSTDPNRLEYLASIKTEQMKSSCPLLIEYHDNKVGKEDVIIKFSEIDIEDSWVWDVFKKPFNFALSNGSTVVYSSTVLTFIDYAGTGMSFGIGLDPDGDNDFSFDDMILSVQVESYGGDPNSYTQKVFDLHLNKPPYIFRL